LDEDDVTSTDDDTPVELKTREVRSEPELVKLTELFPSSEEDAKDSELSCCDPESKLRELCAIPVETSEIDPFEESERISMDADRSSDCATKDIDESV
jgi:hypothetical protein